MKECELCGRMRNDEPLQRVEDRNGGSGKYIIRLERKEGDNETVNFSEKCKQDMVMSVFFTF